MLSWMVTLSVQRKGSDELVVNTMQQCCCRRPAPEFIQVFVCKGAARVTKTARLNLVYVLLVKQKAQWSQE